MSLPSLEPLSRWLGTNHLTYALSVLKALCLGAKGVGIGRSFFYAHSCYGDEGIVRAVESTFLNYISLV